MTCTHAPVYITGNYCKFSRDLSQSVWNVEDRKGFVKRLHQSSVEEELGVPVLPYFKAKEYRFSSSGREDMDVRMLGSGRPFYLELVDPHRRPRDPAVIAQIQTVINESTQTVSVNNLRLSNKEAFLALQASVGEKRKSYRCVIHSDLPVSETKLRELESLPELTVQQMTPIRVLHRRTMLTRPKRVKIDRCEYITPHWFLLDLSTSAGAYVKEFVHGDRGRTTPNLGTLIGWPVDILQLDVLQLHM